MHEATLPETAVSTSTLSQEIQVTVGPTHLERGVPRDPRRCALAVALTDLGFQDVTVSNFAAEWWDSEGRKWFCALPPTASTFVNHFDQGWGVSGTYRFELRAAVARW